MSLAETIALALSDGILTALPLSSSGHAVVWSFAFGPTLSPGARALAQLGAALAITLVVRRRLGQALAAGLRGLAKPSLLQADEGRDAVALVVGAVSAAVVSSALRPWVPPLSEVPVVAGLGLASTALGLLSTIAAPAPTRLTLRAPGGLLAGAAWGLAVFPGSSAVAMAFVVGRWLGMGRWRAAELALAVGIPASLLDASRVLLGAGIGRFAPGTVTAVVVVSFAGALAAAAIWRTLCEAERTPALVLWLVPLSIATIAYDQALPHPTDHISRGTGITEAGRRARAPALGGAEHGR